MRVEKECKYRKSACREERVGKEREQRRSASRDGVGVEKERVKKDFE